MVCRVIGANFNGNFMGQLADVRIWRKALTQKDIESGMRRIVPASAPGLVAYYPLDEGVGLSCRDISK